MEEGGKAGEKEYQTAKRAPIETGISRGTDSVSSQFGRHGGTQANPYESGMGRGRGGLPIRLLQSMDTEENPFESTFGRGRGGPLNRRFHPMDTEGYPPESDMGRSWRDRRRLLTFAEFLRRRGFGRGGSGSADRRSFPEDDPFDANFLFDCVMHRLSCPLHSGRGLFESGMRGGMGSVNRNLSAKDTQKKDNLPTASVEAENSSPKKKKTIPVDGKKIASIFSFEIDPARPSRASIEDSEHILSALKDLGFKIDNGYTEEEKGTSSSEEDSDDEDSRKRKQRLARRKRYDDLVIVNLTGKDATSHASSLVKNNPEATCFLLYFIVKQVVSKLLTESYKVLPIPYIWKEFERTSIPVIIIIQANVSDEEECITYLLNISHTAKVEPHTIPPSANIVIGYLPSKEDRKESPAKILGEELRSKLDVNTVLTNVISRMNVEDKHKISPKFSSTLSKPFYLAEGIEETMGQEPTSYSRQGKYLAYAFLFSQYSEELGVSDFSDIRDRDEKSLQKLKDLGVTLEFCAADGKMTVREFEDKLTGIMQSEDLDSCDCIFIIVSSHGCENLHVYAYDGIISLDCVWRQLSSCEKLLNKPKIILADVCREYRWSEPDRAPSSKGHYYRSHPATGISICAIDRIAMSDTLIAFATTKDKMALAGSGGSLFLENLCEVMKTHSTEDFLAILTETMKKGILLDPHEKQQVTFSSSLRKLLYLPEKKEDKGFDASASSITRCEPEKSIRCQQDWEDSKLRGDDEEVS